MNYGIKYKEFMSLDRMKDKSGSLYTVDDDGFYTTTEINETIRMPSAWISFRAWAGENVVFLQINDSPGVFRVLADEQAHGIDGLEVNRIKILGDAGQKIRLEGLVAY